MTIYEIAVSIGQNLSVVAQRAERNGWTQMLKDEIEDTITDLTCLLLQMESGED